MEYDLGKLNSYLAQFGIQSIESDNILLEWALSILDNKFKDCQINNIELALACLIDILTKIKQNENGGGSSSSKSEKLGTAQLTISASETAGKINENWFSYKVLNDIAVSCPSAVFLGCGEYTSFGKRGRCCG